MLATAKLSEVKWSRAFDLSKAEDRHAVMELMEEFSAHNTEYYVFDTGRDTIQFALEMEVHA